MQFLKGIALRDQFLQIIVALFQSWVVFLRLCIFFQKTEKWESEKSEEDMEEYIWENSRSQKNALDTLLRIKAAENVSNVTKEELLASEVVKNYRNSVIALKNKGETESNMSQYKESVKKLLNIQA